MSIIHMVRHGQASFGQGNYDKLSDLGHRQAEILAEHFMTVPLSFTAVYSGSMVRHKETAAPFVERWRKKGGNGGLETDPHFDEFDALTVWQSEIHNLVAEDPAAKADLAAVASDKRAFNRLFEKIMLRWVRGETAPEVAAKWHAFTGRVRSGMEKLMAAHGRKSQVVVFTSAGPIAAAVQMALSLSDETTMELAFQVLNASVTRFRYGKRGIILYGFNDVSHLERHGDEKLITFR
ncbi:MAG: histidine phosphatase family protein [Deltaproteobacteria bacterium]|nr:histidine phosphatase family protein [Deltaproteobacteria bacterium]